MVVVRPDRKSTRLNSSHTVIYTLSLHDALPISLQPVAHVEILFEVVAQRKVEEGAAIGAELHGGRQARSEEHTSELQSHRDLHSFPTRRSSDLAPAGGARGNSVRSGGAAESRGRGGDWRRATWWSSG